MTPSSKRIGASGRWRAWWASCLSAATIIACPEAAAEPADPSAPALPAAPATPAVPTPSASSPALPPATAPAPYGQPPYYPPPYGAPPYYPPYGQSPYGQSGYGPTGYLEPPPPEQPWPEEPQPAFLRHRVSLQTEAVFSADEGPFYNHLLGGRYDFHTSRAISLGGYVGYANLKGTGKRVHSALLLSQVEYHFYFGSDEQFIIPLRGGLGYLFENGTVVRFATGLYYVVREGLEIGMDVIAPTFWTATSDTVISMNLALEATLAF